VSGGVVLLVDGSAGARAVSDRLEAGIMRDDRLAACSDYGRYVLNR
jgi:hypothetical protein